MRHLSRQHSLICSMIAKPVGFSRMARASTPISFCTKAKRSKRMILPYARSKNLRVLTHPRCGTQDLPHSAVTDAVTLRVMLPHRHTCRIDRQSSPYPMDRG